MCVCVRVCMCTCGVYVITIYKAVCSLAYSKMYSK